MFNTTVEVFSNFFLASCTGHKGHEAQGSLSIDTL